MYIFGADAPMNDTWDLESMCDWMFHLTFYLTFTSVFASQSWFLPFSFCWGWVTTCTDCLFGVAIETRASVRLFVCSCSTACVFVLVRWACSSAPCIMTSSRHRL